MGYWGPVGQFSIRQCVATESYSSRTVFHFLWGMKMADHNLLDLSYSLSFTLEHTLKPSSQASTVSYLHPQTFPPLHGSKLVTFQFRPCHICQKHILNISDFSLSLVHSKANPQRLRLESYFIEVCECWCEFSAAIPLHVCVNVLKGALELPSKVYAVVNVNFFLQTVAPC